MEPIIALHLEENGRYFLNPFLTSNNAQFINREWLLKMIRNLAQRIMGRAIPMEEYEEDGPYVGPSGIAYALAKAMGRSQLDFNEFVRTILSGQKNHLNQAKLTKMHKSRYLTGTLGFLTVEAVANYQLNKETEIASLSGQFRKRLPTVQSSDNDEMLNGRAGFLASLLELHSHFGQQVLSDAEIRSVLNTMISSGRKYSKANNSPAKLMYEWHGTKYLGAAHGVSGIYQMMLSFWRLLDDSDKSDLKQSIDWLVATQFSDGNFTSSFEHLGETRTKLVHWCHGAPGVLHLLVAAFLVLKENKYLEAAERCADLIWKRGILHKGPGICHGVAGNGYAFLLLYRVTNNAKYLSRAKIYAYVMMYPTFETSARVPDRPWSLFEGWAGALCFLSELLSPEDVQFPLIPIPFP